jgi:hypothetical protein
MAASKAARKRPKRKSPGAGTPNAPRAPRKGRTGGAERSSFEASLCSALNEMLDEVDQFADTVAQALGLREERGSSLKRRAR